MNVRSDKPQSHTEKINQSTEDLTSIKAPSLSGELLLLPELWKLIFSYLLPNQVLSVARTCKRFNMFFQDNILRDNILGITNKVFKSLNIDETRHAGKTFFLTEDKNDNLLLHWRGKIGCITIPKSEIKNKGSIEELAQKYWITSWGNADDFFVETNPLLEELEDDISIKEKNLPKEIYLFKKYYNYVKNKSIGSAGNEIERKMIEQFEQFVQVYPIKSHSNSYISSISYDTTHLTIETQDYREKNPKCAILPREKVQEIVKFYEAYKNQWKNSQVSTFQKK